jgi:hypothetical protein
MMEGADAAGAAAGKSIGQNSNYTILAFVALAALLVLAFQFPPLLDYPNHFARMWLLAGGLQDTPFSQIYSLDWSNAFTNLGIDLLARFVGPFIGVSLLAKIVLFLAIVLPPLGAIFLHRALFGGPFAWQIAILFLAWCATLIGGFIDFQLGLGMALIFSVVDLKLQNSNRALLFPWRLSAALLLTLMHLFSVGFYVALICGLEFSWRLDLQRSIQAWLSLAVRLALAILTCFSIPLLLFLRVPSLPQGAEGSDLLWNATPASQVMNLLSVIWSYVSLVDVLFLIPIILVCSNALRTSRYRIHSGLAITATGLLILSIIAPRTMMGTGWISWRFPIMAALTGMAMFCPLPNLPRRETLLLVATLSTAVLGRTIWVGYNWWQGSKDSADVVSVLTSMPAGSAVLPLAHLVTADPIGEWQRHYAWGEDTFRHLPTLATPIAHAFVPTIFTAQGKQPLVVFPPWADIAVPEGHLPSIAVLSCQNWLEREALGSPYLHNWRQKFDYLLILNAGQPDQYVGDALPEGLQLINERSFARLYHIDKEFRAAQGIGATVKCPLPIPDGSPS